MIKARSHQNGQALIESLVSIGVLSAFLFGFLTFFTVGVGHIWLDHLSYQSSLCLLQHQNPRACEKKLKTSARPLLWLGELKVKTQSPPRAKVSLLWTPFNSIEIRRDRHLNLEDFFKNEI